VKASRQQVEPHLIAPIDERPYVALALGPNNGAAIPRGSAVAISHVDVIPPKKDDGIAALKALADPTRKDKGNLRYDVYQQKARPNHFTVIEVWQNPNTATDHETAAHTKQFRQVLGSATGALYDQRWYKAL
jgi:quinol monooxygenase YgiN